MAMLYLTADVVGAVSGGGRVTQEESTALLDFATEQGEEFTCWGWDDLQGPGENPWRQDEAATMKLLAHNWSQQRWPKLCHVYAGTFSDTVVLLKKHGCLVTYTAAAHNVYLSEKAHRDLGLDFPYRHLTDPQLWQRYLAGYLAADVVICPSQHSANTKRDYGCKNIEIIPHGTDVPIEPLPPKNNKIPFVVGYLGSLGPDKGVIYLLRAWAKLNYSNAWLLIGGRDSQGPMFSYLLSLADNGLRNVAPLGWLGHPSELYKQIDLYVQPSVTEGFGIEILEAMAHNRAVLCSTGAGAADVVPETWRFPAENVDALADKIDQFHKADLQLMGSVGRGLAQEYSWEIIRAKYQDSWRRLLGQS